MRARLQLHTYVFGQHAFKLYVPDPAQVQLEYKNEKEKEAQKSFPYWTKVWPAALAMSNFITTHPHYISEKEVLELAAGLGLPLLVASVYARQVYCSDYEPEAVAVMQQSVEYNRLTNVQCLVLNWSCLPDTLQPDVLMLSDINYDPAAFEVLYGVLKSFIEKGTLILLCTPQRLMSKPFIERLLPWCEFQQEIIVPYEGQSVITSVLVLTAHPY